MNRTPSLQRTGPAVWWWGMVTLIICLAPASVLAADEGLCETPSTHSAYDWLAMTPDGWTPATESYCQTPRFTSAYSTNGHCSSPREVRTERSRELARAQARDVVVSALVGVYATGGDGGDSTGVLVGGDTDPASMAWLEDMATSIVAAGSTHVERRAMCLPRVEGQRCESAPPMAVVVSAGSSSPAHRLNVEFDVPWRPGDNELMQPACEKLRVGPSDEHRRLPERPPPV